MLILGAGTATSFSFTNVATLVGTTPQGELPDRPVTTTFQYDPFGRKVRKIVEDGVHPPQTTRYAYSSWQVLEEQDNTGTPQASYVYGRYIDEPIQMKRGDDTTVYYQSDDLYNVTALTNTEGAVVERYRYDDFGAPHVYNPAGASIPASNVGNPYLFTGRAYDADLGLYDYRTRHLHPGLGRFTTRDSIGLWGDPLNMGNPYTYVGNAPGRYVDPYGDFGETVWDAASLGIGTASLGYDLYNGRFFDAALDAVGVVADAIATAVPFLPGGAGALIKAGRTAQRVDTAISVGQGAAAGVDAGIAYSQGDTTDALINSGMAVLQGGVVLARIGGDLSRATRVSGKVPPSLVTQNKISSGFFEVRAQAEVTLQYCEKTIPSQYAGGKGFDFLSYFGEGADAKLFINEAKYETGRVGSRRLTALGIGGKRGITNFDNALEKAIEAVEAVGLDPKTAEALVDHLRGRTATIRLIGSESKNTTFSADILRRIRSTTGMSTDVYMVKDLDFPD